jgi:hypothetical protein
MIRTLYNNPISKDKIIYKFDTEKIYKIIWTDDTFDLVRICGTDLYVYLYSVIDRSYYKLSIEDTIEKIQNFKIMEV